MIKRKSGRAYGDCKCHPNYEHLFGGVVEMLWLLKGIYSDDRLMLIIHAPSVAMKGNLRCIFSFVVSMLEFFGLEPPHSSMPYTSGWGGV